MTELCFITEKNFQKLTNQSLESFTNTSDHYSILKFILTKRVQLLKHFMNNTNLNRESLIRSVLARIESQKQHSFVATCFKSQLFDNISLKEKLFAKIQSLLLYNIYLEENGIIEHISNSNRLFSTLYSKIDIPTSVKSFKINGIALILIPYMS